MRSAEEEEEETRLQHEHAGVIDGGEHHAGAGVVVAVLPQNFSLE